MTKAAPYAAKILSIILLFSSVSGAAFAHEEGTPSGGAEGEVDVD